MPVRCATRFIAGARLDRRLQRFSGRGFFAYEAVFSGLPQVGVQHVVFGGQRRRITLGSHPTRLTRRLGFGTRIRVAGRTSVGGLRAIILEVPHGTGLNGGHLVVVWNADGGAYFTSVHLDRLPAAERLAIARALAISVRPLD